jgi:spore cortex biosynthesis protein YabQ
MRLDTFFTVSEQAELFLLSVCLGAALGVIFDAFRLLRAVFNTARMKVAVHIADFLYVCFYAFCIFLYSTVLSRGEVRFFVVIGSLCGFCLEVLTIGDYVTAFVRIVSDKIHRFFHNLWELSLNFRRKIRQHDNFSSDETNSTENT